MKRSYTSLTVVACGVLFCVCNPGVGQKNILARVGSIYITREDADVFDAVALLAPIKQDTFGLLTMDPVSGLIETEIIYQKVRWNAANVSIRHSREWNWKKKYYISRMYKSDILQWNCGNTDAELKGYYDAHKDEFRTDDMAGAPAVSSAKRTVPPFDSVRFAVARKLFLSTYKPDSTFMDLTNPGNFRYFLTDAYPEYFMKKFYKEKYGVHLSSSLKELCGKNSVISARDIQAAFPLLPRNEHAAYEKDPVPFLRSLLEWKLFSEKAAATGFTSVPIVRKLLEWAWKVEIAQRYVNEVIVPEVKKNVPIDSTMALYSYRDEEGAAGTAIDSLKLRNHLARFVYQQMLTKFDSLMYRIRRARPVRFQQNVWTDVRGEDQAALLEKADSLRDAGASADAQCLYSILAADYAFTGEGRDALVELATIQSEQQENRLEAIKNFRRFLITGGEKNRRSEIMYMIGFIYDRYLDNPEMAEINYQWVIKNAPESRQARDAEVMMQHLGEPMPGSEELQAESKRRGKN